MPNTESNTIRAGIVGVAGYAGGELVRLLLGHPRVDLTYVASETYAGKPLSAAQPGVANRTDLICQSYDEASVLDACDVVFLAQESGFAMDQAPALIDAEKRVIDLSADFRLRDAGAYPQWYKMEHRAPDLLQEAVYGLPELNKTTIKGACLVANPGCFPTGAILALAPLVADTLIDHHSIIINSLSGVSGAGRSKQTLLYHFPELNENVFAYGIGGTHRHTPEIEQALSEIRTEEIVLSFTPHLIPITRGILTTATAALSQSKSVEELRQRYVEFYHDAPFVVVLEPGQFPATKQTFGTNYLYLGIAVDERTNRVTVVTAEDNLVKGAAGQAVQNMNLMVGFEETDGLTMAAVYP